MRTIYLVDDDEHALSKLMDKRGLFMEGGFEIIGAETDPCIALDEIRELQPDAVISDLKMPGLSGMELFEELHSDEVGPLFVIVSAYNEFRDVRKFFLINGFDYLVKPVEDEEITDLLSRLASCIEDGQPDMSYLMPAKRFDEMTQYLRKHLHMSHTLESIGERFSANPTCICNMFSRYLGTTFSSFVASLRMERAESLLRDTDKTIKEVAMLCGYRDALYFTRVFTKTHGMAPTYWRVQEVRNQGRIQST